MLFRSEEIEARLAKLTREREGIGAVNLRAEAEAAEVGEQLAALAAERADLEAAIDGHVLASAGVTALYSLNPEVG